MVVTNPLAYPKLVLILNIEPDYNSSHTYPNYFSFCPRTRILHIPKANSNSKYSITFYSHIPKIILILKY